MIALDRVQARTEPSPGHAPSAIRGTSLTWSAGILAVVGAPHDGTAALLGVLSGRVRVRAGSVRIGGKTPDAARTDIAHVPLDCVLPDALLVSEICELAARLRGESPKPAAERLSVLGLESLAGRRSRSLSLGETRAVSLAIALTSGASLLLVEEPLAHLEGASARVTEALRNRAAAGACVVVSTASVRDAIMLGDQLMLLTQGALSPLPPTLAHLGRQGIKIRIVLSSETQDAKPLVAALSEEGDVTSVETSAFAGRAGHEVVAEGTDLLGLAGAVSRSVVRANVAVETIETAVNPLDDIRATLLTRSLPQRSGPS